MGLLDSLLAASQGSGLLGGLPASWQYQNPTAPAPPVAAPAQPNGPINTMNIGGYQMPQFGTVADYTPASATAEPNAPTQDYPPPIAQPQSPGNQAGFLDRLNAGLQSIGHGGSIVGALTGNLTDPQTIAQAQQKQVQNLTLQALVKKG